MRERSKSGLDIILRITGEFISCLIIEGSFIKLLANASCKFGLVVCGIDGLIKLVRNEEGARTLIFKSGAARGVRFAGNAGEVGGGKGVVVMDDVERARGILWV